MLVRLELQGSEYRSTSTHLETDKLRWISIDIWPLILSTCQKVMDIDPLLDVMSQCLWLSNITLQFQVMFTRSELMDEDSIFQCTFL